jgi:hypothetical protein
MEKIKKLVFYINKECSKYRLNTYNEKELQEQLDNLILNKLGFQREYKLDNKSIIDFYHDKGIGIEVKVKGQYMSIYRQCKRYCKNDKIKYLILISAKTMGLPNEIEGKPAFVVTLGTSWL